MIKTYRLLPLVCVLALMGSCVGEPPEDVDGGAGGVAGDGGTGGGGTGGSVDRCEGVTCDDENPCTTDSCDPAIGCVFTDNTLPCDDANVCTTDDVCAGGECVGTQITCDDDDVCTTDSCDPVTGCFFTNNTSPCDDGDACTNRDVCAGGTCAGTQVDCDDDNSCTTDSCDPAIGCVFTNNTLPCNDANVCTTGDVCAGGECVGTQIICNDDNLCTTDSCNPATGCIFINNFLPCNDGNACTTGDVCAGGLCVGAQIPCDDENPCTTDSCDPATGCVFVNNSLPCNDGNACTTGDTCAGGTCAGTQVTCDDDDLCTTDSCDPTTGCIFSNNTLPCNDGNACTSGDVCAGGTCAGAQIPCDDDNPCTTDSCNPATGCVFTNNTLPCDDGNLCTAGDSCFGGACTPGSPLGCDDQSSCTSDTCNPLIGCTHSYLCHVHATCVLGACECNAGYVGDGYECEVEPPVCGDGACVGPEDYASCPIDCDHDLIVIVEEAIAGILSESLATYQSDLETEGFLAKVRPWTPGTVDELKAVIFAEVDQYNAEGILLIGNMPAAWYQQYAFGKYEEFPIDLYLADRDATWTDDDGDGIYDGHSEIELDVFVSRLQTLPKADECVASPSFPTCPDTYEPSGEFYASEACIDHCPSGFVGQPFSPDVECCGTFFLRRYFDRLHDYRTSGSLVDESAFVFVDDPWWNWGEPFGLDNIYSTVHVVNEVPETTKEKYVQMLEGGGSEFVYHWIHASPNNLLIYVDDMAQQIHRSQIGWSPYFPETLTYNLEASFLNMFSCQAARFTVLCVGMAMVFQTDFGLAVVGSTKNGGIWNPDLFHDSLAFGETWGEAYRFWYNNYGYTNDEWHLGMVLLGDPLLTVAGDVTGLMDMARRAEPTPQDVEALRQSIVDRPEPEALDTYEQYRKENPQFFE